MGPVRYNSWRNRKRKACKRCVARGRRRCHLVRSSRASDYARLSRDVVDAAGHYVKRPSKRACAKLKRACKRLERY